ncbi:hypothetical protein K438DRAFT_1770712 [Mycena galopus ATCC 62051]|nr:hypothetical protein K438DRAFT_1770712 [Mycena galopus ATCC 62051]
MVEIGAKVEQTMTRLVRPWGSTPKITILVVGKILPDERARRRPQQKLQGQYLVERDVAHPTAISTLKRKKATAARLSSHGQCGLATQKSLWPFDSLLVRCDFAPLCFLPSESIDDWMTYYYLYYIAVNIHNYIAMELNARELVYRLPECPQSDCVRPVDPTA